ncbi:MAG: YfhO family protein [Anaerolineae bacterium]|nr:YfhO family protein [Anaerolineae bacterium]
MSSKKRAWPPTQPGNKRQGQAGYLVACGLMLAASVGFFHKIALSGRVLAGIDVFAYFYPYRDYAAEALRAGRLPLWNPYLFMGAPLLANSQAAVLYPLHWPLIWLDAPGQVAWSIVLHVWLAGMGMYVLARRATHMGGAGALVAAAIFALGGFLGAQVEHLNQLNASAWLPWLLLCVEVAASHAAWPDSRDSVWIALLAAGGVGALVLLAGHTQAAYIVFFAAGAYALLRALRMDGTGGYDWRGALRGLGIVALAAVAGAAMAAAQLLPTVELSRLSVRSGGLPYTEAASFSLKPGLLFKAFLPPLWREPPFSEYVAYVGILGLLLAAVGTWSVVRRGQAGHRQGRAFAGLALLGVFLAFGAYNPVYYLLYRFVPGFDLFRAPARWLLLYALGAALLAGVGVESLGPLPWRRWAERAPWKMPALPLRAAPAQALLALLVVAELLGASRRLAYNEPTAPAAFYSMRTAPTHLLADQADHSPGLFRFLSLSDIEYDPGDLQDLQLTYRNSLSEDALYDLLVVTKMKEVLAFNLPLRYRLFSVDGYDGGLLPIEDYVTLERLFLAEDEIWPDGRLRQQLRQVPPARVLSLLNVKYVLTDKTQDAWVDGVYYDLEHDVPLGHTAIGDLPAFDTTRLGIASYLSGTAEIELGAPAATVTVTGTDGSVVSATLVAGIDTAWGLVEGKENQAGDARTVHRWRDGGGDDYLSLFDLGQRMVPAGVSVRSHLAEGTFHLRGMSLIDAETGAHRNVSVHPAYKLVHSGDVKVYENQQVLPRAFLVHRAREVADDEAALALLRDPAFDPAREVVFTAESGTERIAEPGTVESTTSTARVVSYQAEEVRVEAEMSAPGYLVLTDTYYPGWTATVDGQPAPILKADLYFRAVPLDAGSHEVVFLYEPHAMRLGALISLIATGVWLVALVFAVAQYRPAR